MFSRACAKHQQGEIDEALKLYQQAVQADNQLSGAWRNLGALLRQRRQFADAQHCTEQALKLDATDGSLWGNYGNVLRDQGLLEESCNAFQEGLKRRRDRKACCRGWPSASGAGASTSRLCSC